MPRYDALLSNLRPRGLGQNDWFRNYEDRALPIGPGIALKRAHDTVTQCFLKNCCSLGLFYAATIYTA
jgi:hypothetical protein